MFQNGGDFPSISYLYTATGKKVAKTVNIASRNTINYTVDYLDGYQYESGKLLFFPTAEGYVKYTNGVSNPFDYVFNYTDHLGNIRLSYGINPETGMLTKIEENNYYPFGLKHGSYNTEAKIIVKHQPINGLETGSFGKYMVQKTDVLAEEMERPPLSTNSNPEFYSGYNYKFEGREFQDELGLNVYPFRYRTYDPAYGRFWQIDPIAESYVYNSTYAFAENRVVESIDLEGRESWYTQDGSLATKAGPYTSQARQQLNLYSPSEVQQLKAKASNNNGPMFSQDNRTSQARNENTAKWRKHYNDLEATKQAMDNHDNLGSPYTAKRVIEGVAYGAADVATGHVLGKTFQGLKLFGRFSATEASAFSKIGSTGKVGEDALKLLGGESQVYMKTSEGGRFIDQWVGGVANKSKVGYTSLTKDITTQIAKDAELISKGKVEGAVWHFFQSPVTGKGGASQPLLDELAKNGIKAVIH